MKNMIEFYYNIKIDTLNKKNDTYNFSINNKQYTLKPYYKDEITADSCLRLNKLLSHQIPISNIIPNKYSSPITQIENNSYILIENNSYILIENNNYNKLSLQIISNISNTQIPNISFIKNLERANWEVLWSNKIDYYELQIKENMKKFPLIRESFDYFIGLAENAISYLVNTKYETYPTIYDNKVLSHNTISESLLDPSNIILDHKSRDLAEYIKYSFWTNNTKIFYELSKYFRYNYYSSYGIRILFARILYPSFYFELYDQIIIGKKEEKELSKIISMIAEYEYYIYNIYLFLRTYYNIPEINWIKKKEVNLH